MTKMKLIMPILGISTIASVAIPLASCSSKTTTASLTGIKIKTPATTTEFEVGETFNSTGLVIIAKYSDNTSKEIKSGSAGLTTNYDNITFEEGDVGSKVVTVSYKNSGITKTVTYTINVNEQSVKVALVASAALGSQPIYALSATTLADCQMNFSKNKKYVFTIELKEGYLPTEESNYTFYFGMMKTNSPGWEENYSTKDSIIATLNGTTTPISYEGETEGSFSVIHFSDAKNFIIGDVVKLTFSFVLEDAEYRPFIILTSGH